MKQFKSIPVCGVDFTVHWGRAEMPADSKEDYGETSDLDRNIYINTEKCGSPSATESTVLHELCHAVLGISGQDETLTEKQEEGLVKSLENGLYPIICRLVAMGYFRKKGRV